jgi:cytochrome c oxidase assembly protein subunit 15
MAQVSPRLKTRLHGVLGFVTLTILSGALVAGLDAGLVFNTFPLMDGDVVPAGYFGMDPWYVNLFRDHATVQFNHRCLAMVTFAYVAWAWYSSLKAELPRSVSNLFHGLFVVLCIQLSLGILTLLYAVPLLLAVLHQLNAVFLFTITLLLFVWLPRKDKKNV